MTAAAAAPTTAPLHNVAPTAPAPTAPTAPASAAVFDTSDVAASIAAFADPAALLSHLVLAVASRSATAAGQGQVLSAVKTTCEAMLKAVREALLASVGETPGTYDGFTVSATAGNRSLDYDRLEAEYPDVYGELVKIGAPKLIVKYVR